MTSKKVRWNGAKDDPDEITQYGVVFPKGKWVDVDLDEKNDKDAFRMKKFEGNPTFEVQGEKKPDPVPVPKLAQTLKPARIPAPEFDEDGEPIEPPSKG